MVSTTIKNIKLGLISLSALAVLAACGDDTPQPNEPNPTDDTTEDVTDDTGTTDSGNEDSSTTDQSNGGTTDATAGILLMNFEIGLEDALQIFYDTFGENANIDQVDFDADRGEYYYEIQGWEPGTEYELDVHANTGEVRDQSTDSEDDQDQDEILDFANYITPEEAMNAALNSDSDVIEGWTLDIDDGRAIYEIDFEGRDDVDVDAITGDII